MHVSVSELYSPSIDPQMQYSKIGGPIVGIHINCPQIYECRNWERRRAVSFPGIFVLNCRCSAIIMEWRKAKQDGAEWQKKVREKEKILKTVPSARGADRKMGHYIEQPGLLLPGDLQITLWDKIYILGRGHFLVELLQEILLYIIMHTVLACI
jgi:hypothetical protein